MPLKFFARETLPSTKLLAALVTAREAVEVPVELFVWLDEAPPEVTPNTPKYDTELPAMVVLSELLVVIVIVPLPTGGLSRYQTSLRTKNVPDAPVPQEPPELSSVAFKHVRLLEP